MKEFTVSQQHLDLIGKLKLTSIMTVPLISRLKVLGAMTLGLIRPDRHYNLSDLKFVEELANRAAIAIDNAGLYRDAQEAIQVRDEFLSIASHELRTPITPLMLQLQAMLRMANRNSHGMLTQDELVKGIKKIERQTERLSRLVDELLNVSRLRAGRMNLNLETFDLSQLIRDIVERYRVELEKSHCVPILHLESSMLVYWDPLRIEEAIVNLLENAMKFGKSKPIDISLTLKNEEVELSVKDQGMGISAQDQKRIFERFERAVSITEYGGFGLGLYITRKIVEGHGGSIQVESHLGKGSIFTIHLPARAASDQLQAA
jgi:signal transduction histidine kinase